MRDVIKASAEQAQSTYLRQELQKGRWAHLGVHDDVHLVNDHSDSSGSS